MNPPSNFKTDKNRDATDSIRGYLYQVYQSIAAWISLKENEILILEGAEDFDIHSGSSVVATQVKDVSNNITLRSKEVVDSLNNFWSICEKNPDHKISLHFLTTAEAGQEKGAPFGDNVKGLDFWQSAMSESVDIGSLRIFMQTLDLHKDLASFIKNATNEEIREKLIKKIKWNCGNKRIDGIKSIIKNKLKFHGSRFGVNTDDSVDVLPHFVNKVIDLLSTKGQKRLEYTDFLTCFDEATRVSVSISEINASLTENRLQQAAIARLVARSSLIGDPLPIVDGGVFREAVIPGLVKLINEQRVIFIYGSSGLGKTNLAALVSRKIGGSWGWAGFRNAQPDRIKDMLSRAAYEVNAEMLPPYLVLDDIDLEKISQFEYEFISLVFSIIHANGMVIVTGPARPPLQLLPKIWKSEVCEVNAPYFDKAEISEMIRTHGLSDENRVSAWAEAIFMSTRGHPQLVHARVRTLSTKQWPKRRPDDLFKSEDIERVREDARKKLLLEFPTESTRVLAYRLSLLYGSFSRETAMAVAGTPPPTTLPGEAFDALVGPWIEREGKNRFRISPLLTGAANNVLLKDEVTSVHRAIANAIINSKNLNQFEIGTAFFHAYMARDSKVLWQIAHVIIITKNENIHYLNDAMGLLTLLALDVGQKILPGDKNIDFILRLAQYKLSSSSSQHEKSIAIIDRIEEALHEIEPDSFKKKSEMLSYGMILNTIGVHIPSSTVIKMLSRIMDLVEEDVELKEIANAFQLGKSDLPTIAENKPAQVLFAFEAVRLNGLDDLFDLIQSLDKLPLHKRGQLLKVFNEEFSSLLINRSWWKEVKDETLDISKAMQVFQIALQKSREWSVPDLIKACLVATSVIQDEYAHSVESALKILDSADIEFPNDAILINQRAKVLFHAKRDSEAIPLAKKALSLPGLSKIEYVFCCRSAGIATAKASHWIEAEILFKQGADKAISSDIQKNMAIGLMADAAFALWKQKRYENSIALFADTLTLLAAIPIQGDIRAHHLHATVRHIIAWIHFDTLGQHSEKISEPIPGMCSNQEPHKEITDHRIIDISGAWQFLSLTEKTLNFNLGIATRAQAAIDSKKTFIMGAYERTAELDLVFKNKNFNDLIPKFIEMIEGLNCENAKHDGFSIGEIPKLTHEAWCQPDKINLTCIHILMASVIFTAENRSNQLPIDKWRADLKSASALSKDVDDFLNVLNGGPSQNSLYQKAAESLFALRSGVVAPTQLWRASFRLLNAMMFDKKRADIALERLLIPRWDFAIHHQRFAFVAPALAYQEIEQCCTNKSLTGLSKVAAVLKVSAPYVNQRMLPETEEMIKKIISDS